MSIQYVKVSSPEMAYGKKNLLTSQLEMLNILKRCKQYKKLREEEFVLKIALKNKVDEAKNNLIVLEKLLPRMDMPHSEEVLPQIRIEKERSTLEDEIEEIKRKLAQLQL